MTSAAARPLQLLGQLALAGVLWPWCERCTVNFPSPQAAFSTSRASCGDRHCSLDRRHDQQHQFHRRPGRAFDRNRPHCRGHFGMISLARHGPTVVPCSASSSPGTGRLPALELPPCLDLQRDQRSCSSVTRCCVVDPGAAKIAVALLVLGVRSWTRFGSSSGARWPAGRLRRRSSTYTTVCWVWAVPSRNGAGHLRRRLLLAAYRWSSKTGQLTPSWAWSFVRLALFLIEPLGVSQRDPAEPRCQFLRGRYRECEATPSRRLDQGRRVG